MHLEGFYFDGKSSKRTPCVLTVSPSGHLQLPDGVSWQWHEITVSPRIGNTARYLDFPDGSRLESTDNEIIDQLCLGAGAKASVIHNLESRLRYALAAVLITVLLGWWFVASGIPVIANQVAHALPANINAELGHQTLTLLDNLALKDSQLSADEQVKIRADFDALAQRHATDFTYQLHFRGGGLVGANAFALPSGDIVITDELIALATHPDAISGVLAHEIGHVEYRHITRRILHDSALPLLVTAVTGDMSVATSVLAGLPTLMVEAHYSREFEEEADQFALEVLHQNGRDPRHLAQLLARMNEEKPDKESSLGGWLSSHPATDKRIERLESSDLPAR